MTGITPIGFQGHGNQKVQERSRLSRGRAWLIQNSPFMIAARHAPGELREIYPGAKALADASPKTGFLAGAKANASAVWAGFKAVARGKNPVPAAAKTYVEARVEVEKDEFPPIYPIQLPSLQLQTSRQDYAELFQSMHQAWPSLVKKLDRPAASSLVPLPNPYVVPGGKFKEMYYWDSYFIMLGLQTSHLTDLMTGMVDNMLYLSEKYGIVPNANRTYYMSRTQPPFLTAMIDLAAPHKDKEWLSHAYDVATKEYRNVWMNPKTRYVKKVGLNRYYDPAFRRMPENNRGGLLRLKPDVAKIRNARAECESGWDFTKRFDHRCTDFLPVDLNSLLYKYEKDMAGFARTLNKGKEAEEWDQRAEKRKKLMNELMWDEKEGLFMDYDFRNKQRSSYGSLASYFPLWAGLATPEQARRGVTNIHRFEGPGGLKTSLHETGEQWDAPNGWPNLNWIAIKGIQPYDPATATRLGEKWLDMVKKVHDETGAVYEKYNVEERTHNTKGHYPSQALFGWGLGVSLAILEDILGYQVT